jgi:hypothetical protein
MSGKDLILDFLGLLFMVAVIGFCIFYFIVGNRVEAVSVIMKTIAPFSFFGAILVLKWRINNREYKKRQDMSNFDIVIYLTYMDKLKSDLFLYSLPIIVIIIPFLAGYEINTALFLQACIVFVFAFIWQRSIFNKQR